MIIVLIIIVVLAYAFYTFRRLRSPEARAQVIDTRQQSLPATDRGKAKYRNKFLVRPLDGMSYSGRVGDRVYLFPEPSNKYDSNAIIVSTSNTNAIGYIAREDNSDLFEYLQEDGAYSAKIVWSTEDKPKRYMVEVYATRYIDGSLD